MPSSNHSFGEIKLKISHKGLILVAVPLAFELIFVVTLAILLTNAENAASREAHNRTVVSTATDLAQMMMNAGSSIVTYRFLKSPSALKRYDRCILETPKLIGQLKELTKDDKSQLIHVRKMELCSKHTIALLTEYRTYMTAGRENSLLGEISVLEFRQRMQASFEPFMKAINDLQGEARSAQEGHERRELENRNAWRYLLVVGMAANIVVAILLAIFFSRNITHRLSIVMDNSLRLGKRAKLNHPVGGTDEIAQLDNVFHKMADILRNTEEERQQFFSMISHDLRSPLMNLKGTLTLFEEGTYGDITAGGMTRLTSAQKNLDRLIEMINQVLLVEKLEAGMLALNTQKANLREIIQECQDSLQAIIEHKNLELAVVCPSDLTVEIDKERIFQVVANLLSNAVKFSPAGGTISIAAAIDAGFFTVEISDEGPGVTEENVDKIFDRFRMSEQKRDEKLGGSGLGLSICKKIVELHQGEIGVQSKVGEGSTFWFRLPVTNSASGAPER